MTIKDKLFVVFMQDWNRQFEKLKAILYYLNTYPEELHQIKNFYWIKPLKIEDEQKEWLWLISQFDNPIESTYFKPWWIPVNALDYDQFIDLSSPTFELFQVEYSFLEPYHWIKYPMIRDIPQLMLSFDNNSAFISKEKENTIILKQRIIDEICSHHSILRLEDLKGINLDKGSFDSLFIDDVEPLIA